MVLHLIAMFLSVRPTLLSSPAPPITFKVKLRNQQVEEESSVTLSCELSKPGLAAEWRRGLEVLKSGVRHQIRRREAVMELTVRNALLEDSGVYCCVYGDALTTANLTVTRKDSSVYRRLCDSLGI